MATITEGLAELKTLTKRIEKKREHVLAFLTRLEGIKDPLGKDGGSSTVIERELQAIADLETRIVAIRTAIQKVNLTTPLTVEGVTRTIAEWLTWKKEVASGAQNAVATMRRSIQLNRQQALQRGAQVVPAGQQAADPKDLVVNVDEVELAKQAEHYETVLGTLDGKLSLLNATVIVEIAA